MQLILEPGFSTAENLTQAAGRGVGMDVVATEVKKLGGALHMETHGRPGLAIHHPPAVHAGRQLCADRAHQPTSSTRLPLPTVEGVVRVPREEVAQHLASDSRFLRLRRPPLSLPAPGQFRRHGGRSAAGPGADAAGGAGARRRTFHRPRGRGAGRQPRNRREAGGSADRRDPRHLRRHHPGRRAHRRHSRHRRAGARRLARPQPCRHRAAREAGSPHDRAGGRRLHHGAPRDAAPAGAQWHARADRARRRGRDHPDAGNRARHRAARHRDAAHGRLRSRDAHARGRTPARMCPSS